MKKTFTGILIALALCPPVFSLDVKAVSESMPQMVEVPENAGIKGFKIASIEVTQKLYRAVTGKSPSYFADDENPVERVSWYDAVVFCNMLSKSLGKVPVYSIDGETDPSLWQWKKEGVSEEYLLGEVVVDAKANGYRLPSITEWEHAARDGTKSFTQYSGSSNIEEVGWYYDISNFAPKKVAQKKPNGLGLYDMTGNVREWCFDAMGDITFKKRCHRGGSWSEEKRFCEVSNRQYEVPSQKSSSIGFRIACSL